MGQRERYHKWEKTRKEMSKERPVSPISYYNENDANILNKERALCFT